MRMILFAVVFLLFLSSVFSVIDKIFDTDKIFNSKKKTIYLYATSSLCSTIMALGYDYLIYGILR